MDSQPVLRVNPNVGEDRFLRSIMEQVMFQSVRGPWNYGYLLLALAFLLNGCADSSDYVREVKEYSAAIAAEIDVSSNAMVAVGEQKSSEKEEIEFFEACLKAARNDKDVADILTELAKAGIDFDGVRSNLLPRLNVAANAEVPLENSNETENDLTGGIFVEYDIWRAVAVGDETVLRRAMTEKNIYQLRLIVLKLQQKVLQLQRRMLLSQQRLDKKKQVLALAEKGNSLAKVYVEQQQRPPAILVEWRGRQESLQVELEKIRAEQQNVHHELNHLLGETALPEVLVSDVQTIMAEQEEVPATSLSSAGVWGRHDEARLYELELIAAEVAVSLVKLDRLPKINASLGLGKIPLESNTVETASTLMRFSVAMPLWDMGDYQRKYAKSQLTRDSIKKSINNKVALLWNRVQLARDGCEMANRKLSHLAKAMEESRQRLAAEAILAGEGRSDGLIAMQQRIELFELELQYQEALANLDEANDTLRLAAGLEPVVGTTDMLIERLTDGAWRK